MKARAHMLVVLLIFCIGGFYTRSYFSSKLIKQKDFTKLFNVANEFLQAQKFDEAIEYYKQVIVINPACIVAYFNLGQACMKKSEPLIALEAYTKILELNSDAPFLDQVYLQCGVAYHQLNQIDAAIDAFSCSIEKKPQQAMAYINRGNLYKQQENFDDAFEDFSKAAYLDIKYIDALLALGSQLRDQGEFERAIDCFKQAKKIKSNDAKIYQSLADVVHIQGRVMQDGQKVVQAQKLYEKACEFDPACFEAYHNLGLMYAEQGKIKEAICNYEQALVINSDLSNTRFCLGMAQIKEGELLKGFENYEYRWHQLQHNKFKDIPYCNSANLQGKTILLHAEGGLGDTFHFIRYAKKLKDGGAKVIAYVQKPLSTILSRCPYLDQVINSDDQVPTVDAQVPFLSLPYVLKTDDGSIPAEIPYLFVDLDLINLWKQKLSHDANFKIGICWQVDSTHDFMAYRKKDNQHQIKVQNPLRSVPIEHFAGLARLPGVRLYSLQMTNDYEQFNALPTDVVVREFTANQSEDTSKDNSVIYTFDVDFDKKHGSFMDTAAVMKSLDLVITVDTSIAHLAGGLGVPVWILLPRVAEWRWFNERSDSPWYPTARLFRQTKPGDWVSVMNGVINGIKELMV